MNYLKDVGRVSPDAQRLAQGLMEVLDPGRRTIRLQREAAQAATAGAQSGRERRASRERRKQQLPLSAPDRRNGHDRRARDRRG
jgi:hypothetical protein